MHETTCFLFNPINLENHPRFRIIEEIFETKYQAYDFWFHYSQGKTKRRIDYYVAYWTVILQFSSSRSWSKLKKSIRNRKLTTFNVDFK